MRSVLNLKFKTDLIINWIYPIKTHSGGGGGGGGARGGGGGGGVGDT